MESYASSDFIAAHDRIKDGIHRTPLMQCHSISEKSKRNILLKCENLQRTGSFKIRGALNAARVLQDELKEKGSVSPSPIHLVTHSSGNFGQALSLAARLMHAKAHVVVPRTAPATKVAGMKGFGAEIHFCEPTLQSRTETCDNVTAEALQRDPSATVSFLHPYDNPNVIRGQGTMAIEILEQFDSIVGSPTFDGDEESKTLGAVIVPVGGGGLISGVSSAIKALRPGVKVFGAEPTEANDASRSLQSGVRQTTHVGGLATTKTIADGLMTFTSERTFGLIQKNVDGIIEVSEEQIREAFQFVFERAKIVIEPSAAVGVAAAMLSNDERLQQIKGSVVVVLSGGNVDFGKISLFAPSV